MTRAIKAARYVVYFPPSPSADHELLRKIIIELTADRGASDFLRTMVLRGWMSMLHGLSEHERMLQLKSVGISDALLSEIQAVVPHVTRTNKDKEHVVPSPVRKNEAAVVAPPLIAVPENSSLGSIGAAGGLA